MLISKTHHAISTSQSSDCRVLRKLRLPYLYCWSRSLSTKSSSKRTILPVPTAAKKFIKPSIHESNRETEIVEKNEQKLDKKMRKAKQKIYLNGKLEPEQFFDVYTVVIKVDEIRILVKLQFAHEIFRRTMLYQQIQTKTSKLKRVQIAVGGQLVPLDKKPTVSSKSQQKQILKKILHSEKQYQ